MTTVNVILYGKGNECYSIPCKTKVTSALQLLAEKNVGALPVVCDGKIIGIFSERDFARKVIQAGFSIETALVDDMMSKTIYTVKMDEPILNCMNIMTQKHIRHLPVVEKGEILGIISIGDVVNYIIKEQKATISDLEKYITGAM